ncbi:Aminoglycoside 6'-N-acetyltransferase [Edwardsiella anguillarum]|uniref:GNAT family N-acetyltransferase n=1 Tax=Edwardsiella TaxID=635 RepID=UPI00045D1484|nr:GNAT family N-acetyltransferase [Edwardsiella anguillarum]GAJ68123.1 aminoglycoside 6'-N-acetyltransferase [Edwardsiella piscicida]WHP79826.1 GNAT family N-acetyltransferase [Edwardsiella anguillarum]WHQ17285.1 GNAT family N-acetyltransferase [Edwardsiella anguillarum]WHQ20822.1 GNAT family N-acetyltransferase [Edwardsiella anguillarum]WHQ24343.1 GNAT family N-acetyltransferase [Edwardsiella anguillarum]
MTIVPLDETMMRRWVALRAQLAPQTPLSRHWLEGCALLDAAPYAALLALDAEGEAQGFVEIALQPEMLQRSAPARLRLCCLFVSPDRRRRGVATALMAAAAAWGRQRGCAEMVTAVALEDRAQQRMLAALGLTEQARQVTYRLPL